MNVNWIERSQKTIDQLEALKDKDNVDRLEMVKDIRFAFGALSQSLGGWMQWINSPEIMSQFTQEELKTMSHKIINMVIQFVEYDRDITDYGMKKGLGKQRQDDRSNFVI
jgi:hypothetical protein